MPVTAGFLWKVKRKILKELHILFIGHITKYPSGSVILSKQLVDILRKNDIIEVQVVNTSRHPNLTTNWLLNIMVGLKVIIKVLLRLKKTQIVTFHASNEGIIGYGPVIFGITRIFRKPLVLRVFGGSLDSEYEALSPFRRWLFDKTIIGTDLFLVETKHLFKYFEQRSSHNIKWFPNSRKIAVLPQARGIAVPRCKRFIFLGSIKEEKGIDIIFDSVKYLMPEITVDLFGPLEGKYTVEYLASKNSKIVRYMGVLIPAQVYEKLFNYDAIILPTFYKGEGYPGVIVEAYSHGLPVITTRWQSIPEIVCKDSGILIPPHSAKALAHAMNKLHSNTTLYARLKQGAISRRKEFSDSYWANRFVEWCEKIVSQTKN